MHYNSSSASLLMREGCTSIFNPQNFPSVFAPFAKRTPRWREGEENPGGGWGAPGQEDK